MQRQCCHILHAQGRTPPLAVIIPNNYVPTDQKGSQIEVSALVLPTIARSQIQVAFQMWNHQYGRNCEGIENSSRCGVVSWRDTAQHGG